MITVRFSWVASQLWTEVKSLSGLITQSSTWTTGQGTSLTRLVILRMKVGNTNIRKTLHWDWNPAILHPWSAYTRYLFLFWNRWPIIASRCTRTHLQTSLVNGKIMTAPHLWHTYARDLFQTRYQYMHSPKTRILGRKLFPLFYNIVWELQYQLINEYKLTNRTRNQTSPNVESQVLLRVWHLIETAVIGSQMNLRHGRRQRKTVSQRAAICSQVPRY